MSKKFTVNGREYDNIEQMSPDDRATFQQMAQMLADRNNNGVPDIFEAAHVRASSDGENVRVTSVTTTRYQINGKEVERWEDLPQHVRDALQDAGVGRGVTARESGGPKFRASINFTGGERHRDPARSLHRAIVTMIGLAAVIIIWLIVQSVMRR